MDFLTHPLLLRAAVVGVFGGAGLSLTCIYSRRGPMIYPVYAALLAALTMLLARDSEAVFQSRFAARRLMWHVPTARLSAPQVAVDGLL